MSKLIAMLMLAASVTTAAAANIGDSPIKFQDLKPYTLECESTAADHHRVLLAVIPSEMTVKLANQKREIFSFPITDTIVNTDFVRNEFGRLIEVPYVASIEFRDHRGELRMIANSLNEYRSMYLPADNVPKPLVYNCIPVLR
jgi:hypothetical protein